MAQKLRGENMVNSLKLKLVLDGYKKYFPLHWKDEKYKWEAIKNFHDHWDIDAESFIDMFKKATADSEDGKKPLNLLAASYFYPRDMILYFAREDETTVRNMFRTLFDESLDLTVRIEAFQSAAESLRSKYDDGTWRNHYQNTNAISTYLWLRYPDKYYIYKYELFRKAAILLDSDHVPKRDGSVASMIEGFRMYDEICEVVKADPEIRQMIRDAMDPSCYPDPEMKTATIDVGFYLARFYLDEKAGRTDNAEWFPADYSPNLTVDDWVGLLKDPTVFTDDSLRIMKRMKDYGGQATCKQLSVKYGGTINFYNSGASFLARRVAEKTGCPVFESENGNIKWWPVLYVGKHAGKEDDGNYIWKLRDELSEAIDRTDLSRIELISTERSGPATCAYTKTDFLSTVYMSADRYDALEALVRNKMNVILQGAPGVGKTFAARRLAYAMMGEMDDSRIEMVQFHQNYSYEDFVMGYRPDGSGFKLTEGIFYRFCRLAAGNPDKPYFFIIDEINRGNMSRIFGELLMLIEKDYREIGITLAYNGTPFSVPENLYLIGMMNTADRSLAMIDYALRRRFSFFEMEPAFNSEGFIAYQNALANETFDALIGQIKILNREITEDKSLGRGFQIGHSYFCGRDKSGCTEEWMHAVVEYDILPTLNEYWFDEPLTLNRWEKNLRGVFDD